MTIASSWQIELPPLLDSSYIALWLVTELLKILTDVWQCLLYYIRCSRLQCVPYLFTINFRSGSKLSSTDALSIRSTHCTSQMNPLVHIVQLWIHCGIVRKSFDHILHVECLQLKYKSTCHCITKCSSCYLLLWMNFKQ